MDIIDQNILRALQVSGRLSNQELSKKIGLSPSPCLRRVRSLEENGVLTGYTALVDQDHYGLPINVFVSVRLEKQSNAAILSFEESVNKLDEVLDCFLMTGNRDYLLRVVSQTLKSYEQFIREKLTTIPGIAAIESNFALGRVKQRTILPLLSHFEK